MDVLIPMRSHKDAYQPLGELESDLAFLKSMQSQDDGYYPTRNNLTIDPRFRIWRCVFICSLGGEALVVLFLSFLALFALFHRFVLLSEVSE